LFIKTRIPEADDAEVQIIGSFPDLGDNTFENNLVDHGNFLRIGKPKQLDKSPEGRCPVDLCMTEVSYLL
jgi:hypothetical protein